MIEVTKHQQSLAEQGKCVVIGKQRVTGKGCCLIIDEKPKGLSIGRKICRKGGFPFTVTGFGGLHHMKENELILSPNETVGNEIQEGDVLELIDYRT